MSDTNDNRGSSDLAAVPAPGPLPSRRDALKGIAGAGMASALPAFFPGAGAPGLFGEEPQRGRGIARPALIREENARPGTRDWMLRSTRIDATSRYRCPWIEGYASHTSVRAGEKIRFHASADPAAPFTLDLYRMGYYGGAGARHLKTLGPFPGKTQIDPPVGPKRLRECRWEPFAELQVPEDWPSGVYLGKLSLEGTGEKAGLQSYLIFIVRDDRPADFIFQCSDTTWQSYNRWPNQYSLYDDGKKEWFWGSGVEISFDRPYGKYCQILDAPLSTGSGEWFLWEFPLAYWMESKGYDVTYISNLDTHSDPGGLMRAKGFLSVGHDEYYSIEMFNHLRAAIDGGLHVAFLSGNTCCGKISLRPSSDGTPNRILERIDRYGPRDPVEVKDFPEMDRFPWTSPNENLLIGARSTMPVTGGADWICAEPGHWIFEGTGMKKGDGIPGLVGWEWHGDPAAIPGLQVVATGKTKSPRGEGVYTATIYPGPRKNFVFNASSCWWADGIAEPPGYVRPSVYTTPKGPDPRARKITENLLARMIL